MYPFHISRLCNRRARVGFDCKESTLSLMWSGRAAATRRILRALASRLSTSPAQSRLPWGKGSVMWSWAREWVRLPVLNSALRLHYYDWYRYRYRHYHCRYYHCRYYYYYYYYFYCHYYYLPPPLPPPLHSVASTLRLPRCSASCATRKNGGMCYPP